MPAGIRLWNTFRLNLEFFPGADEPAVFSKAAGSAKRLGEGARASATD